MDSTLQDTGHLSVSSLVLSLKTCVYFLYGNEHRHQCITTPQLRRLVTSELVLEAPAAEERPLHHFLGCCYELKSKVHRCLWVTASREMCYTEDDDDNDHDNSTMGIDHSTI